MNCSHIQKLLHAHHDGELDAAHEIQVEEHLADCPECFGMKRNLSTLRGALRNDALRFTAPASLRQSLRATLAQSAAAEQPAASTRRHSFGWIAAMAAVLIVAVSIAFPTESNKRNTVLIAELTSDHVRSLMANHLMDVVSTDQHTVKPWFDGKLDFAPPVKDLQGIGFPLLGGRLDYVAGRSVAALVYGRHKHIINLFIWPIASSSGQSPYASEHHGYNLVRWSDGRMNFAAVSDLNASELQQFANGFLTN